MRWSDVSLPDFDAVTRIWDLKKRFLNSWSKSLLSFLKLWRGGKQFASCRDCGLNRVTMNYRWQRLHNRFSRLYTLLIQSTSRVQLQVESADQSCTFSAPQSLICSLACTINRKMISSRSFLSLTWFLVINFVIFRDIILWVFLKFNSHVGLALKFLNLPPFICKTHFWRLISWIISWWSVAS